jgi:hypothetical protein
MPDITDAATSQSHGSQSHGSQSHGSQSKGSQRDGERSSRSHGLRISRLWNRELRHSLAEQSARLHAHVSESRDQFEEVSGKLEGAVREITEARKREVETEHRQAADLAALRMALVDLRDELPVALWETFGADVRSVIRDELARARTEDDASAAARFPAPVDILTHTAIHVIAFTPPRSSGIR